MLNESPGAHYFYYNGEFYGFQTVFTVKREMVGTPTPRGVAKKIWKKYKFTGQIGDVYYFNPVGCDVGTLVSEGDSLARAQEKVADYGACIGLKGFEIDKYVAVILTPENKLNAEAKKQVYQAIDTLIESPKRESDSPGLVCLWIVYILLMIGSLIFKQFYLLWIALTIAFVCLRHKLKNDTSI